MITLKEYKKHLEKVEFDIGMLNRHADYLLDEGEMELSVETIVLTQNVIDYLIWLKSKAGEMVMELNPNWKKEKNITVFDGERYSILEVV
jgi:hypothetical protein